MIGLIVFFVVMGVFRGYGLYQKQQADKVKKEKLAVLQKNVEAAKALEAGMDERVSQLQGERKQLDFTALKEKMDSADRMKYIAKQGLFEMSLKEKNVSEAQQALESLKTFKEEMEAKYA